MHKLQSELKTLKALLHEQASHQDVANARYDALQKQHQQTVKQLGRERLSTVSGTRGGSWYRQRH